MKRIAALFTTVALVLSLCACGKGQQTTATWQEQYDLGMRYLTEGNYAEAIVAFTAAIEIDPKQADAYLGLADAYVGMGDVEAAEAALRQGYDATGDERLLEAVERLTNGGSDEKSGIDTTQDEVWLADALLAEGAVSYGDLPEILSAPFNQLDAYLPVVNRGAEGPNGSYYLEFEWTNKAGAKYTVHSCSYDSNPEEEPYADISAAAPLNGTEILRIDINSLTGPIGFRDIQMGDGYATVVKKLGLDPTLAEYAEIQINLFAEDESYGFANRESQSLSNGDPAPCILVHFGTSGEDYEGQNVTMWFNDRGRLDTVFHSNEALMNQMG